VKKVFDQLGLDAGRFRFVNGRESGDEWLGLVAISAGAAQPGTTDMVCSKLRRETT
jgi:hypothetical protein